MDVSPEFLIRLGEYSKLELPPDRAQSLSQFLSVSLEELRAIRPEDYEKLTPAITFKP